MIEDTKTGEAAELFVVFRLKSTLFTGLRLKETVCVFVQCSHGSCRLVVARLRWHSV